MKKLMLKGLMIAGGFGLLLAGYGLISSQTVNTVSVSVMGSIMGLGLGLFLFAVGSLLVLLGVFR